MTSPCWLKHKWITIHKQEIGVSYFRHRTCLKCHKHELGYHLSTFSTWSVAYELGREMGFYKLLHSEIEEVV